jgi:hypothetical protein
MPALLSDENWVTLKPVLWSVRGVEFIHYPSCTHSIKPSLQFSSNFVVINAYEGCYHIFKVYLDKCYLNKVDVISPRTANRTYTCTRFKKHQ